jgi:protein TonB
MELIGYELEKAKEDKRKGMITTILIHVLLLLVMIFLFKFMPPDPPIEEQGIAINFGTSDQGMGDVQPKTTPSPTPSPEKESAKATPTPVKSSPSEKVMTSDDPEAVNLKVEALYSKHPISRCNHTK